MTFGLLAQFAVTWVASCGTVTRTSDSTAHYTAPTSGTSCVVTTHRLDTGRDTTAWVRFTAPDLVGPFAAGLTAWPLDQYCTGPMTASAQQFPPADVLARVQLASRCGVRLVVVPPRRFQTVTGTASGRFSLDSAKRVTDAYARVLPPDTLAKYRTTLLGFNLGDDYNCLDCWGGVAITPDQIAAWAASARGKLPGLPLGVRVTPDWVARSSVLPPLLDYAWAQWHAAKGDQQAFYRNARLGAEALGLRLVVGVAVEDCAGIGTAPCTASELLQTGTIALAQPACAVIHWRYDAGTWAAPGIVQAYDSLARLAAQRPFTECRRG